MIRGRLISITGRKKVIFFAFIPTAQDLVFFKKLVEAGKLQVVIDRAYPLEQIAQVHRYVETMKKGASSNNCKSSQRYLKLAREHVRD